MSLNSCCPRVWLENSSHVRGRVTCENVNVKESHIGERRNLASSYKRLGYSPYCQLVLWWNPTFYRLLLLSPTLIRLR